MQIYFIDQLLDLKNENLYIELFILNINILFF